MGVYSGITDDNVTITSGDVNVDILGIVPRIIDLSVEGEVSDPVRLERYGINFIDGVGSPPADTSEVCLPVAVPNRLITITCIGGDSDAELVIRARDGDELESLEEDDTITLSVGQSTTIVTMDHFQWREVQRSGVGAAPSPPPPPPPPPQPAGDFPVNTLSMFTMEGYYAPGDFYCELDEYGVWLIDGANGGSFETYITLPLAEKDRILVLRNRDGMGDSPGEAILVTQDGDVFYGGTEYEPLTEFALLNGRTIMLAADPAGCWNVVYVVCDCEEP